MRPLTLITVLSILICFSSCATSWQYITLDSREVTKDTAKRFTWENDTLRLVYNFSGYGGPVWMSITNKAGKPMYVNWKKSAIINQGYASSLFASHVQMTGAFDARRGYGTTSGSLAGSFSLPEGMDFIPPGSSITKRLDVTVSENSVPKDQLPGNPKTIKAEKIAPGFSTYKLYTFDEPSSPLQFKSYLTFVLDGDNAKEFSVNQTFYAREIMVAQYSPVYFAQYRKDGDILYVVQSNQ